MTKWRAVEELILRHIRENGLRDGAHLPPDRSLAEMARCSVQPVMRAMESLEKRGLVRRGSGLPTTVVEQPPLIDDHELSFTNSTRTHGDAMATKMLDIGTRLPLAIGGRVEIRAQKALGLRRTEPFHVITRIRLLDGTPRVLHRAFLNPACFAASLFADHDFKHESLVEIYNTNGYQVDSRETTLRAREPTKDETDILKCSGEAILEAEQQTDAVRVSTGETVTLEYMQALYVKWEYRITNRRTPTGGKL